MSHQINFMDDGFPAEKKGANKRFFFFNFFSPENGASEEAPFDFSAKMGRAKKRYFFQRKKRKTHVIFRRKKMVSPNKNGAAK